jgi:hypothetical protein
LIFPFFISIINKITLFIQLLFSPARRGLPLVIILLSAQQNLTAQENVVGFAGKFRAKAGFYLGSGEVVDHYFSALPYSGLNYSGMTSFQWIRPRSIHEVEIWISGMKASPEGKPDQSLRQTYFKGAYNYWLTLSKPGASRFVFLAGGGASFRDATRNYDHFINNYQSYEFMASLNALFKLSYRLGQNNVGLKIEDQIHLPVFGVIKQPELGGNEGNWQSMTWNELQGVENELSLEKKINRRHSLSIEYRLDFYSIHSLREVSQVQQAAGVTYAYSFD